MGPPLPPLEEEGLFLSFVSAGTVVSLCPSHHVGRYRGLVYCLLFNQHMWSLCPYEGTGPALQCLMKSGSKTKDHRLRCIKVGLYHVTRLRAPIASELPLELLEMIEYDPESCLGPLTCMFYMFAAFVVPYLCAKLGPGPSQARFQAGPVPI